MKMLNSKKGFFMSARDWISFFVGLVIFIVGLLPLLKHFKILPFGLPAFLSGLMASIFFWVIALAGLYLVVDGIIEPAGHTLHTILMILGIIFIIVGLIPILITFKVIGMTMPSIFKDLVFYNVIIVIEGIMLMSAGFTMR